MSHAFLLTVNIPTEQLGELNEVHIFGTTMLDTVFWVRTHHILMVAQVAKPDEVKDAEQASSPVSDDTILRIITAFNVGVGKYTKLVRRLLPKYAGYECKEPESGKFTLSFR